jgi:hypothetical protein
MHNFQSNNDAQQRALAAGTKEATAGVGKLRHPDNGMPAILAIWHRLAINPEVDDACHNLDRGVPSDLVEALCALGPLLTVDSVSRLSDYHDNVTKVAHAAVTLMNPVTIDDWMTLFRCSTQRSVPFDCTQPTCLVCRDEPENADDNTYFVTNAVCTSHSECAFDRLPVCACQALFCIECAARLFHVH